MSTPESKNVSVSADELNQINAYCRAANYLSVGQIDLRDNPLLREPLELSHEPGQ